DWVSHGMTLARKNNGMECETQSRPPSNALNHNASVGMGEKGPSVVESYWLIRLR
ncbi:cytidine/deoxycytidylate deaminase, partial [Desmospora sp. 8437]